ncbi:MAG: hypothetical protein R2712_27065 [Vicinamibacterales bacterium]
MHQSLRVSLAVMLRAGAPLVLHAGQGAPSSPLTIDALMAAPFPPTVALPWGRRGLVASTNGVHNVWTAAPPAHQARQVTAYTGDEGCGSRTLPDVGWHAHGVRAR